MTEIKTTTEELQELVTLEDTQGQLSEIYVAREILDLLSNSLSLTASNSSDHVWTGLTIAGSLLRVGFILGQREERRRRKAAGV